jgi:hypothetical protein
MAWTSKTVLLSAAVVVGLCATGAYGQPADPNRPRDQDRGRERVIERDHQTDRDRALDRDRMADRARDRDRLQDRDFYGFELMTEQERAEHRERLRNAQSDAEWAQIRAEHQEQMQERAREKGINLTPPVYGAFMMTAQERERFQERLERARNEPDRIALRAEHQEAMRARARELGVELPAPLYGQQLMTAQEQLQFRDRLRAATTEEERMQIRAEHRNLMQERAREHQLTLDEFEDE